ncbi:Xaa-His dipeptidase [Fusibacter sp. 3D3]|nr:Xaa-His dipeptidase [Fusibacter sp. 3D3]
MDLMALDKVQFLKDLEGLMGIPSISSDLIEVKKALAYVLNLATDMGLKVQSVLEGRVGIVEMGQGDETVGVLVHVDVVSAGNLASWDSDPFKLDVRAGQLYGRGVADDKGPVISILHAMKRLLPYEKTLKKKIQLIIGTQEEVKWTDMSDYTAQFKLPDFGFTPDGEFPITNIEKGYADVAVVFKLKDHSQICSVHAGSSLNSVPDEAVIELAFEFDAFDTLKLEKMAPELSCEVVRNRVKLMAKTVSVHSSKPQEGVNAIWVLCNELHQKKWLQDDFRDIVEFIMAESYEDFYGVHLGFETGDRYVHGQFADKTVVTPTLIRMTDDFKVRINFNIRHTVGVTQDKIEAIFSEKAKAYGFTYEILEFMDFLYVDQSMPFLGEMAKAYEEVTGHQNEFILAHGSSYAKAMPNFVAWGPYFPDEADSCHEINEHLDFENLIKATEIYTRALYYMTLSKEGVNIPID